jgi:tRNA pseudouridine13 synthase
MSISVIDTPAACGSPLFHASLKTQRSDFIVDEVLDIEMEGEGEHLYLHLQKSGMNTDELAQLLEKAYSVGSKDVGLAGMKDRHAITSQWFSVTTPQGVELLEALLADFNTSEKEVLILKSVRHSRKLRHGAHKGNRFVITLRDVTPTQSESYEQLIQSVALRVASIAQSGFPNYIGPQRFGFGGQNLMRARQWFKQPKKRTSRQQRSLWLSAARSAVFNAVCAKRVEAGNWQSLLPGEPAILDGTRSFFEPGKNTGQGEDAVESSTEELEARLQAFDIHPSAPWWGRGRTPTSGECATFESEILSDFSDICEGLEKAGLSQERRPIRALARDLEHQWLDNSTLQLSFHLSPGLFATTLLKELGVCDEPDRRSV